MNDSGANDSFALLGCIFLAHLTRVQHLLESWGETKEICLVGLYHSIYGSELFVRILPGSMPSIDSRLAP